MLTNVQETSIEAYHAHHASGRRSAQSSRILCFIKSAGGDWSIGEIAKELKMDKSTVSARVYELLNETHELVAVPKRKDRVSGIIVRPVTLAPRQECLLAAALGVAV